MNQDMAAMEVYWKRRAKKAEELVRRLIEAQELMRAKSPSTLPEEALRDAKSLLKEL